MSKIYIGKHKSWGTVGTATSAQKVADEMGCDVLDLEIEIAEKTDWLLSQVPKEMRAALSYMAYERGHSAGEDEVELILERMVSDFKKPLAELEKRAQLTGEVSAALAHEPLPIIGDHRITREEVMEGLRSIYEDFVMLMRKQDPTFRNYPDYVKILDHIEQHGLPPKPKEKA